MRIPFFFIRVFVLLFFGVLANATSICGVILLPSLNVAGGDYVYAGITHVFDYHIADFYGRSKRYLTELTHCIENFTLGKGGPGTDGATAYLAADHFYCGG